MNQVSSSSEKSQDVSHHQELDSRNASPARRRPGLRSRAAVSPNTPDTIVTFAPFQRSQARREGRPENIGALSGHPRIERQMQQLCNELEINAHKIDALRAKAHDTGKAVNGARLEALRTHKRQLATQLADCMRLLDPDLSGTVMERVKSSTTSDLEQTYVRVWDDYQRTQKSSCTKYLWTVLSGGFAYAIPFGTGTMLARGLNMPYLVLLAGPLHTLAEPVWSMLRATTWTNPASEAYTGRQRARARANGDAWRYLAKVPPKTKMLWIDPVSGERALLTAAQALATNQELWLWLHKTVSDDLPFFIFALYYSIKNVLGDVHGPALFDRSTPDGMRNDLLTQFATGFLSGATAMLLGQLVRRALAPVTRGTEVVTKSLHIWHLQAMYLKSYSEDIKDTLARRGLKEEDARLLRAQLREVETELAKASAKSTLRGSIGYELSVMFQKKRLSSGTDPDLPGKRLDTVCSILGKTTSLLPSLAVTYLCQPLAKSPDFSTRMIAHTVVPLTLIFWPGFAMRTELQDWYRSLFGAFKGIASAMRASCCCCCKDPDETNATSDEDEDEDAGKQSADDADPDGAVSDNRHIASNPDSNSDSVG